jgi:DNA-binding transcriptional LysR family regulator
MDVRKLEAFCKVYELQSFSKAGELMFLSQPTISSHVANLEAELGVKLFDRLGRKVLPTQAGDVLYRNAIKVFDNLQQAKASIEMLRDRVVGELVVGCSTIPAHNVIPGLLARFSERYPEVTFTLHTGDSAEIIRQVLAGNLPMGIVGQKPDEEGLEVRLLLEDETVVVAAAGVSWLPGQGGAISVEELAALPWIMRERGSATRRVLEEALAGVGLSLNDMNVRCRVEGTCETIAHTLAGVGVSVTSSLASDQYVKSGELVRLNVPQLEGRRRFYLIHNSGRHMFPALRAFVDFVNED